MTVFQIPARLSLLALILSKMLENEVLTHLSFRCIVVPATEKRALKNVTSDLWLGSPSELILVKKKECLLRGVLSAFLAWCFMAGSGMDAVIVISNPLFLVVSWEGGISLR